MSTCAAKKPQIGVLALQGAFIEHEDMLKRLGADCHEIRERADLDAPMDGLVLPGGESTTQKKLLADLGLYDELHRRIAAGLPVLATCAGLILLAKDATQDTHDLKGLGPISMTFIRAPYIEEAAPGVDVLATVDDHIVAVKYHHQIGLAFHPELGKDTRIHEAFLKMAEESPHSRLPL